ncbi:MAG: ABC transporter substrate-binding protein [Comamonas sp.]
MSSFPPITRRLFGTSLAAAAALAAAPRVWAQNGTVPVAARNEAAIAAIAQRYRFVKDGVFTVGISAGGNLPLNELQPDGKTVVGYHPEFAQNIAESLGRRLELAVVAWADWPLGLASGKFDAVISNVTVTEARKEKFDFSTYRVDLLGFYVKASSPIQSIKEPKDVAGLRIITDAGTNQESILLRWDQQNRAAGLKPVEVQYYDDDPLKTLALQSGRADVIFSVNASLAFQSNANKGQTRRVGTINGGWPLHADIAIATRRDAGLAAGLTDIINGLIANGQYLPLLKRWGLESEAIERSLTNPPGLPKA